MPESEIIGARQHADGTSPAGRRNGTFRFVPPAPEPPPPSPLVRPSRPDVHRQRRDAVEPPRVTTRSASGSSCVSCAPKVRRRAPPFNGASTFGRASSCAHAIGAHRPRPHGRERGRTRLPTRLTFSIFLALRLTACVVHVTRSRVSSPRVFSTDAPREPVRRGVARAEPSDGRRVVRFGVPDVVHERGRRRRLHKRGSRDPGVHGQRDHRLVLRASHERGLPRLAPVLGGGAAPASPRPSNRGLAAGGCHHAGRRPVLRSGAGVSHVQTFGTRLYPNSADNSPSCVSTRGPSSRLRRARTRRDDSLLTAAMKVRVRRRRQLRVRRTHV